MMALYNKNLRLMLLVNVNAYYAAVLISRIMRLVRPSVRPSVCLSVFIYWLQSPN